MLVIIVVCDKVIIKGKQIVVYLMEVFVDFVDFEDGFFLGKDSNKFLVFGEIVLVVYIVYGFLIDEIEFGFKESCFYDLFNFIFLVGCYICEVEIDLEMGELEIVVFVVVDDFGMVINFMIVEGQVYGGLV